MKHNLKLASDLRGKRHAMVRQAAPSRPPRPPCAPPSEPCSGPTSGSASSQFQLPEAQALQADHSQFLNL